MGALIYRCLPYLISVCILVITKKPIHNVLYYFIELSGIMVLPLAAIVLWRVAGYESKSTALASVLLIGLADMVDGVGGILLQEKLLLHLLEYPPIFYLLCILTLLLSITIFIKGLPGGKHSLRVILELYGICVLGNLAKWLLDGILGIFMVYLSPTFATNMMLRAIGAIMDACILYFLLLRIHKEPERTPKGNWKKTLLLATVGMSACIISECILLREEPEKRVQAVIAEDITMGSLELIQGNIKMASAYYHNAFERKAAWEYALGITEDEDCLEIMKNSSLLEVKYIYWQYTNDIEAMENYLLEQEDNMELAIELLDMYANQWRALARRSKAIQKDIISMMIANGTFTDNVLAVKDLENREDELEDCLEEIQEIEIYVDAVDILDETGKNGGINKELTERMLAIAEECPRDISLQYFAIMYGCAYKEDGATHYERTLQAAERFVKLYGKQDEVTEEQKRQSKLWLAEWAMELGFYEKAILYIEEALAYQETQEVLIAMARCQNELGRTEDCYKTSRRILEKNPNNYGALYYAAVASLKRGDIDQTIEYTIQLSDIVQSLEGKTQHQAEVMLYDVLQYQGFCDLTYNNMIYNKITAEQRQRIEENPFYAAYLEAVYYCFTGKKYDLALEKVEYVLSLEAELSQAQYLKGCIYFGMKDYEKAAKALEKSVAIDTSSATAWYSLANAYDALGRYEDAYEASIRVDNLLPDTDHHFDPYGIAIHNSRLKARLEEALGIKGE